MVSVPASRRPASRCAPGASTSHNSCARWRGGHRNYRRKCRASSGDMPSGMLANPLSAIQSMQNLKSSLSLVEVAHSKSRRVSLVYLLTIAVVKPRSWHRYDEHSPTVQPKLVQPTFSLSTRPVSAPSNGKFRGQVPEHSVAQAGRSKGTSRCLSVEEWTLGCRQVLRRPAEAIWEEWITRVKKADS